MCVLIEGVETVKQLRVIETLGTIAEAQGYLFSAPVPESGVPGLLGRDFRDQAAVAERRPGASGCARCYWPDRGSVQSWRDRVFSAT